MSAQNIGKSDLMRRNAIRNEVKNDNDRIFIVAPALVEGLVLALQQQTQSKSSEVSKR